MKALLLTFLTAASISAQEPEFFDVFTPGSDGYPAIRIPSVVVTTKGSVLAFAEARKTLGDQSENKIVTKRSTDGGATWSALKLIHDDGANSLNNPTAAMLADFITFVAPSKPATSFRDVTQTNLGLSFSSIDALADGNDVYTGPGNPYSDLQQRL